MSHVISIVGRSNSGKTTLIENLIPEFKKRGYHVAAIKHASHGFTLDYPGKDSDRLRQAGADMIILASTDQYAVMGFHVQRSLEELEQLCTGIDIILVEGYKQEDRLKIEVYRHDMASEPEPMVCSETHGNYIALVTDDAIVPPIQIPVFRTKEIENLAHFIETTLLLKPVFIGIHN
ncbi:MAG: molybdopterin-guanine dinucleotide biosynthesis protein B [Desulfobacterales bacterium]|nr:molybdopterin-guanine dinucleotide biosynthesis protein B [Desulfobacterales bacterium]